MSNTVFICILTLANNESIKSRIRVHSPSFPYLDSPWKCLLISKLIESCFLCGSSTKWPAYFQTMWWLVRRLTSFADITVTAISRKFVGKMCTQQSRKVVWDMINTLFLTTVTCWGAGGHAPEPP